MGCKVSTVIAAEPSVVFEACADFAKAPERVEGILNCEVLTDGPIGQGTRFRETRIMFGKEASEEMEVTQFERGKSYTVEAESCGAHYTTKFDFQPENGATRVTMEWHARPVTLMAKLMQPLGWLMSGFLRKCIEKDLESIKSYLEAPGSPAVA